MRQQAINRPQSRYRSPTRFRSPGSEALEREFQTLDMGLVTTLIHIGFPLLKIEPIDRKKVTFFFENSADLQEAITDYYNNEITVEPRKYFDDLKALKTRIHNTIDNEYEN